MDQLSADGFRPISLAVYGAAQSPLYAAVWVQRPSPVWKAFHGLDGAAYQAWADARVSEGFRPVIIAATGDAGDAVYAGVWEHSSVGACVTRHDLRDGDGSDQADWQHWFEYAGENRLGLRWAAWYGSANDRRLAAIWDSEITDKPDLWFTDAAGHQTYFDIETAQLWMRPELVTLSSDQAYLSIYRDAGIGDLFARHGMTAADYQAEFNTQRAAGLMPIRVQAGGIPPDHRFAAIFANDDQPLARQWTTTGVDVPDLADLDDFVRAYMQDNDVRAGALAVAHDGQLKLARGYTWAEPGYSITEPDSLFRIASSSKPITSIALHQLIEHGELTLEQTMQDILNLRTPGGSPPFDADFATITIAQLLNHLAGFDASIDPMFMDETITGNRPLPISKADIASFMAAMPLGRPPGTVNHYSNFGFCLLGLVIEELAQTSYEEAVDRRIWSPLGLTRPAIGASLIGGRRSGEVRYHTAFNGIVASVRTADRPLVGSTYGGYNIENMDSHGAWIMAAPDFAKILAAFDATKNPLMTKATVTQMWTHYNAGFPYDYLNGWVGEDIGSGITRYWHNGGLPGTATVVSRRTDGTALALFFNKDVYLNPRITIGAQLETACTGRTWPSHDLFPTLDIPTF